MAVSFGISCFSTQIENSRLRTMMLSDNCCMKQNAVVHQGCFYTIMFHHLMLWFVNWCILFGALYAKLITC